MGNKSHRDSLTRRLMRGLKIAKAGDISCEASTADGVLEFIAKLRNRWPKSDQGGIHNPAETVREVWAASMKVPGVTIPPCPTLPDCDLVTRVKADREYDGRLWQEFHNALTIAQRAVEAAIDGFSVEAKQPGDGGVKEPDKGGGSETPPQMVTLLQAASMVNRQKRTLEGYKQEMPKPKIRGGGGKPDEWLWDDIRPWLERKFGRELPKHFPGGRFIPR